MDGGRSITPAVWLFAIQLCVVGSGCRTPERSVSYSRLLAQQREFLHSYESELKAISRGHQERIKAEYLGALDTVANDRQCHDLLVLSGGGALGAFGAGLLEGWGQVTDPEFVRPTFDYVSGISTGSLIAPFAFIGTPEAYRTIVELYENAGPDLVRKRGFLGYLPGNASLYDVSNLHSRIRAIVTPGLIRSMASGASDGRQLVVGAANLDYGLMRVWDLARIAHETALDTAIEKTVAVLLASTAIPAAFPPVLIDDLLYVDGGASMQVVSGIGQRDWVHSDSQSLPFGVDGPPIRIRIWMIVNQKLVPDPVVVRPRWPSIAARSLSTLVRTSTLQSIQDTETYVRLIDQHPDIEAEMRYVAIPQEYSLPKSEKMFALGTMRGLIKLGREIGSDPTHWRTNALRPGAPFVATEAQSNP